MHGKCECDKLHDRYRLYAKTGREDTGPKFGDMVQVIDFADRKEAEQYPTHPAHQKLMQEIGYAVDKVVAIDVEG